MGDGKALQMGTSHELGQNFAKAFDIEYLDAEGTQQHAWTTSWGVSTRMVGGLIMSHGDDNGLRVPPRLAPVQAVVLVVRDDDGGRRPLPRRSPPSCAPPACGSSSTTGSTTSFGRRATDWELKGVPVRLEVGPRDLAEDVVTLARRDRRHQGAGVARRHRRRRGRRARRGPGRRCWPRPPSAATAAPSRSPPSTEAAAAAADRLRPDPVDARSAPRARPSWPRSASPSAACRRPTARCPTERRRRRRHRHRRPLLLTHPVDPGATPGGRRSRPDGRAAGLGLYSGVSQSGSSSTEAWALPTPFVWAGLRPEPFRSDRTRLDPRPDPRRRCDHEHDRRTCPSHRRAPRGRPRTSSCYDLEQAGGVLRVTRRQGRRRRHGGASPPPPGAISRALDEHDPIAGQLHPRGLEPRPRAPAAHPGPLRLGGRRPGLDQDHARTVDGDRRVAGARHRRRPTPPSPSALDEPVGERAPSPFDDDRARPAPSSSGARRPSRAARRTDHPAPSRPRRRRRSST